MTGEKLFLNELKDYINNGISKNDLKTLINQRIKQFDNPDVKSEQLICEDKAKSICNNPLSHECCNKHNKRI